MKRRQIRNSLFVSTVFATVAILYFHERAQTAVVAVEPAKVASDQVAVSASVATDEPVAESEDAGSGGASGKADYRESSLALHDRLEKVTVYSDRAELTRVAKVKLKPGRQWLRFDEIAAGFFPNTARVTMGDSFSGKLVQIAGEEVFTKGILKAETRAKVDRLRGLYGELLALSQRSRATERQVQFLRDLKFDTPFARTPASTNYRPFSAKIESLRSSIDEIHAKTSELTGKSEDLHRRIADQQERISLLEHELENQSSSRDQDWRTSFYALVDSRANQTAEIELHYQVPNALWRPIYDVRAELDHDKGVAEIKLVTAGMIEQKTGEDWHQVDVTLSSLDPVALFLPPLNRRLLKETRTEAPRQQAFGAKTKRAVGLSVGKENVAMDAVAQLADDRATAGAPASAPAPSIRDEESSLKKAVAERKDVSDKNEIYGGAGRLKQESGSLAQAFSNAPVEKDADRSPASFTLDRLERLYPSLDRYARAVADADRSRRIQPLDAKLTATAPDHIQYTDSTLPAVQAQGRRIEFGSPFPVDVRTDDSPLKVPVHTQSLVGKLSYYAVPKNDARVFLKAHTTNTTERPILGGEAQVYMEGDLVSKTALSTISEDAYFDVDLGVDRNVETKRIVSRTSKTSGLISTTHQTDVAVKIELANHHPYAIDMEVKDNYPRSPAKEIEARLTKVEPDVSEGEKDYGVITWKVRVPARSKKTVSFEYEVSHPENYLVSEFN
ncbi:MAG: mucoidy inhibitor MuiA family protein [Bdellovibrionales bacterium]|nr:mucoidy inhibitor MuiA family protein [Bdellovibrionales bacterium]